MKKRIVQRPNKNRPLCIYLPLSLSLCSLNDVLIFSATTALFQKTIYIFFILTAKGNIWQEQRERASFDGESTPLIFNTIILKHLHRKGANSKIFCLKKMALEHDELDSLIDEFWTLFSKLQGHQELSSVIIH